jgi:hypothetical protein
MRFEELWCLNLHGVENPGCPADVWSGHRLCVIKISQPSTPDKAGLDATLSTVNSLKLEICSTNYPARSG